jgi:hypothetical protein
VPELSKKINFNSGPGLASISAGFLETLNGSPPGADDAAAVASARMEVGRNAGGLVFDAFDAYVPAAVKRFDYFGVLFRSKMFGRGVR